MNCAVYIPIAQADPQELSNTLLRLKIIARKEEYQIKAFYAERQVKIDSKKPKLNSLLNDICHDRFDVLLVPDIKALVDSCSDIPEILQKIWGAGVTIKNQRNEVIDPDFWRLVYRVSIKSSYK